MTHLLRSLGPEIEPAALAEFDDSVMAALGRIVACDLSAKARLQAELPTCQGGTGLVPASRLALAAFVAARIESRPIAVSLLEGLAEVSGDVSGLADYAASLEAGRRGLLSQVGGVRQAQVDEAMARGAVDAAARFAALRSGQRLPGPTLADVAEAQLIQPAGVDDPEAADAPQLQGIFCRLWGEARWEELDVAMRRSDDWPGLRRMSALRHPFTDHSWMGCLHPVHGPALAADEYVDALSVRLGLPFLAQDGECPSCGGVLDRFGVHAQKCAQAESTRGHYRVCHQVHMLAAVGDLEAASEP